MNHQLNLKLFSRQYLLKASLINCISTLLWIINLHFIRKLLKITFNNYSKHGSTFNIYPILRAACVKIAYVFSSMAISSRDSQVQKRWRLVGTPSAHLSRPRFENKTNCLVSSLFSRSSFPLFLSLFLPPLLPFSPWPSAVATRVHYTRDAPREGGEKGSYLICFPSGPLHRYRPHTFSFGLGARQGGSERIIGIREMEEDEEEEEEELPGLEGEAVRTVLHEFLLIRTFPSLRLIAPANRPALTRTRNRLSETRPPFPPSSSSSSICCFAGNDAIEGWMERRLNVLLRVLVNTDGQD